MNEKAGHTSIQAIFIDPQNPFHKEHPPTPNTPSWPQKGGQYKQPINKNLRD